MNYAIIGCGLIGKNRLAGLPAGSKLAVACDTNLARAEELAKLAKTGRAVSDFKIAVAGCRLQGAQRIICIDMSQQRLELARGQGATDTWVGGPETVARVLEETGGFGADYTFEATGLVAVMRQAVEAARMGWGLCTIAGVAGKGETLDIVPRFLITGRRVCGSSFGGVKGRDQVPELVQLYLDGKLDVDPFISHRIALDEVNRGFELMERQDGIRSVIEFD